MVSICAQGLEHKEINEFLKDVQEPCTIEACIGQRFIATGMSGKDITIKGIPGNALGAYLNGGTLTVLGNAQDASVIR